MKRKILHEEEIKKLEEALKKGIEDKELRIESMNLLRYYKYENILEKKRNDINGCKKLDDLSLEIIKLGKEIVQENKSAVRKIYKIIKQNYEFRARRYFKEFLICKEWEYEDEMKFYYPRRMVLDEWIDYLQKLEEGELQGLSISAPPRTGKTGLGTAYFEWNMLRHPDKSCFFVTHTNAMAKKVYTDIINDLNNPKKRIKNIFPEFEIVEKNAEDLYIQLKHDSSNNYKTAYFRGIDGNMSGILEASWLLYCDDLIKGIEEALNPDRLQNARTKYAVDISQRRKNKNVKELHIATRWSVHDVISTLESLYEDDEKWKFIRKPAINENGESNFMYDCGQEMDMEHWNRQRNLPDMDEVSFNCIYQQEPMEREGLLFMEDELMYYTGELPEIEPDLICAACDVAWGGGDYLSMPIAYVYGLDVYIHDVVYNDKTKRETKPLVKAAILKHGIKQAFFEANNGGDEYADDIAKELKAEKYRCAINSAKAPTVKTKLARILACVDEIKGLGEGYRLHFLDRQARKGNKSYELFMKHIFRFNQSLKYQGKQKDDGVDSLSMLLTNVLNARMLRGTGKATSFSKRDIGV